MVAFRADHAPAPSGTELADIEQVLTGYVRQRCSEAAHLDTRFAEDVGATLADLVLRGGKRLRPALLWWGWLAGGKAASAAEPEAVLRAAAALELLQACALVHDDLMDDSPLRRGAPSLHETFSQRHRAGGHQGDPAAFGVSAALLAGDLALVWADDLWETSGVGATARRRAHPIWRAMRTEMAAGQYLDLYGQASQSTAPAMSLQIAHLKGGAYTVERPLLLGAALAGAGGRTVAALRQAGRAAGLAFQLRDDLLGVFGDPERTGKPAGEDVRCGKSTYLITMGLQLAHEHHETAIEQRLRDALGNRALTEGGLDRVRAALIDVGAREAVETHIGSLVNTALTALDDEAVAVDAARSIADLLRPLAAIAEVRAAPAAAREN
jgi:geranylgeranyl diphosphate synthase type I